MLGWDCGTLQIDQGCLDVTISICKTRTQLQRLFLSLKIVKMQVKVTSIVSYSISRVYFTLHHSSNDRQSSQLS